MQTPVFKDIDELSQKATIAGTEKLPVSDTEYITPDQIADLAPSQKQSDWNEIDQDDPAFIKNKPSIPAAQVNSDWNAVSGVAEILNKPTIPDVSGKADKVSSPTSGHFAGLDGNGNLTDSGSKASDFATASQGGKADTAYQKPSGGIPSSDMASAVQTSLGKADTAVQPEAGKGLFSGSYNDLTDKPTIPDAQIQSDWSQGDSAAKDYIKNKPTIPDISNCVQKSQTAGLLKNDGTVDTTSYGTYSKPSGGIPASDMASGVIPDPVEANPTVPSGTTPATLLGLKVGDNYFNVPSSGGGGVSDVTLGGTSVVSNGVAVLPAYPTVPTISTDIETDKASNTKTASPKAVYDEVHPAVGSSQPAGGMLPNVFYDLGTLSGDTTFSFATPSDNTIENEYMFEFTTPSTAPTITWPNAITGWSGGTAPTISASKTYQVSVLNGLGVIAEF